MKYVKPLYTEKNENTIPDIVKKLFTEEELTTKTNIIKDPGTLTNVWSVSHGRVFTSVESISKALPAGVYYATSDMSGNIYLIHNNKLNTDKFINLPDDATTQILTEINKFWGLKDHFAALEFIHKRGILLFGPQGCHIAGTKILMYNGNWKKVEEIKVNDLIMGPDSTPRKVLTLHSGIQKMVKITPKKGKPFIVNEDHILALEWSGEREGKDKLNISVKEYKKLSNWQKSRWMLYKSKAIEYSEKELKIPPYILGTWLGDGSSAKTSITTMDEEIRKSWENYANNFALIFIRKEQQVNNKSATYNLTVGNIKGYGKNKNPIKNMFNNYNLINNKHIPRDYLTSSIEQRKELLAGLIDTDGYVKDSTVEFTLVNSNLIDNIEELAQSLGYSTNKRIKIVNSKIYYRLTIICDENCETIPVKLLHKKLVNRNQKWKNSLRTSFTIEDLEEDNYYGFEVDKDNLYIMEDYFVSHNSGKTATIMRTIKTVTDQDGIILLGDYPKLDVLALKMLRTVEEDRNIVCIYEDIDDVVRHYGDRTLTALLDGDSNISNILYLATTNYPERLPPRLINRPSRFDTRKYIGFPSADARRVFLQAKGQLSPSEIEAWVEKTDKFSIPHLKELIILVKVYQKALDEAVTMLKNMSRITTSSEFSQEQYGKSYYEGNELLSLYKSFEGYKS